MKYAVGSLVLAALLLAGCSTHGSSASAPLVQPPSQSVSNVGFSDNGIDISSSTVAVGMRLTGESSFTSKRYGVVLGYFKGKTSFTSQVISLFASTPVRFFNVDTLHAHTLSFLGDATMNGAPWPQSFNGSFNQSSAGTAIGTTSFSTGILNPGTKSLLYTTGMPGFYMVGCYFHYNTNGMRTVIIVK